MMPRRISSFELKRFEKGGEVYYILRDDNETDYYRFNEPEAFIWDLLDGKNSVGEIVKKVRERFGELTEEGLELFLKDLEKSKLIEGDVYVKKYPDKEERLKKAENKFSKLLSIKFPILHPDKLCDSIYKRTWWLFSKWMTPIYLILIILGLTIFSLNFSTFSGPETIRVWDSGYVGVIVLFIIFAPMGVIHEFCHALACKKFNRHVWEIGVMLYLIQPYLYCDTSDAWLCEKKSERIFVSFAGPLATLLMGCGMVLIWEFATLSPFAQLTLQRLVYFNFLSVLFGFNPLILLDGYYMLMDALDVPNLRTDSFEFLKKAILAPFRSLVGKKSDFSGYSKKQKVAYSAYGSIAAVVTSIILIYSISMYYVMWDLFTDFFMRFFSF